MDLYFEGSDERSAAAYEFLEPHGWEIYGPNDRAMEPMRQAATSGPHLKVQPEYLGGFLRMQSG